MWKGKRKEIFGSRENGEGDGVRKRERGEGCVCGGQGGGV